MEVQLRMTVNGDGELSARGAGMRNRWPSPVTSHVETSLLAVRVEKSGGTWNKSLRIPRITGETVFRGNREIFLAT